MPTFTKRIGKRGTSWYALVRCRGVNVHGSFHTKKEASEWAYPLEAKIRKTGVGIPEDHTFVSAVKRYTDTVLDCDPPIKSSETVRVQKIHLAWWLEQFRKTPVSRITTARISEARDRLKRSGRSGVRSNSTCNRFLTSLSALFTVMKNEWQWVTENPVSKIKKMTEPPGRVVWLEKSQISTLLDECKASRSRALYPLITLLLSTGMRLGEALALTWKDVSFEDSVVYIQRSKNKTKRGIPLNDVAVQAMREYRSQQNPVPVTGHVFVTTKTSDPGLRWSYARALERAGLDPKLGFHALRHVAASHMVKSGVSLRAVAEILGHKTLSQVMRYSHLAPEHLREATEDLKRSIF